MKSFRKVFSELEKICSSDCEQVVQLNDFFTHVLSSMSFWRQMRRSVFFCVVPAIWVFLGV